MSDTQNLNHTHTDDLRHQLEAIGRQLALTAASGFREPVRVDSSDVAVERLLSRINLTLEAALQAATTRQPWSSPATDARRMGDLVAETARALTHNGDLHAIVQPCTDAILRSLGVTAACVWTVQREENTLLLVGNSGVRVPADHACRRMGVGEGLLGRIAAGRGVYRTSDLFAEVEHGEVDWLCESGTIAFLGLPLIVANWLVGVLCVYRTGALSADEENVLRVLADQIALGVGRKEVEHGWIEAQARTNQLLASISSIIISIDVSGHVIQWNEAAHRHLGPRASEVLCRPILEGDIQWDCQRIETAIKESIGSRQTVTLDNVKYQGPQSSKGLLRVVVNPMVDSSGCAGGVVLVAEDTTDASAQKIQLAQAQRIASIGQLAAGIAHEINTPTQFVSDNTRFLRDSLEDMFQILDKYAELCDPDGSNRSWQERSEEIRQIRDELDMDFLREEIPKAIEQSLEGVERVTRIVRSMKEFSHPGGEDKQNVDLNRAIETTVTVARNEWKYVADLVTHLDPSLPPVLCYAGDINQVFLNIIVNAAHAIGDAAGAGEKAGEKGTITISTCRSGDWAEIRISDTGCGIPQEIRSQIFDPFFTTKEVGKGTGQGLAISHTVIVQKHGGTIDLESDLGRGTTFIIRLPLEPEQSNMQGAANSGGTCTIG